MADTMRAAFLGMRLKEMREENEYTMQNMVDEIKKLGRQTYTGLEIDPQKYAGLNKSSLSRLEAGKTTGKTATEMAKLYCLLCKKSEEQTNQFLRGERIAIPDTSALLKNVQLIDDLNKNGRRDRSRSSASSLTDDLALEYSRVIIPRIVLDELDKIKNRTSGPLGQRAWEVIRGISYGDRTLIREYTGNEYEDNEDCKIINIARSVSDEFHCHVDIITDDTDYSAYLKGDGSVSALHLREYMLTKQTLVNMVKVSEFDQYYAESYADVDPLTEEEANAYLADGNTLIISIVRNRNVPFSQRCQKIRWLIETCGADVNKRDCSRRYFPPISHAIQAGEYDMFLFLLETCKANPNVGSRNPYDAGQVRQKNEGNMPLMIAAWHGKIEFLKALCEDERTSINQQDANGFTALMKASMNGWNRCIDYLKEQGADQKIVDINGMTAQDWYNNCLSYGKLKDRATRNGRNTQRGGRR